MADPAPSKKESQAAQKGTKDAQQQKDASKPPAPPINISVSGQLELKGGYQEDKGQHKPFYEETEVWLVIATVFLVIVTARLAGYTRNLWTATVNLSREAKDTADRQGRDTLKAIKIAEDAAKAAQESADAARSEFVASHRPEIAIRHVYITSEVWGEKPIEVKLVIVNKGLTPAVISQMNVNLVILPKGTRLPPRPQYPEQPKAIEEPQLESGRWVALPRIVKKESISHEDNSKIRGGTHKLYCHGFVEYFDVEGRIRRTSFCRVWQPPDGPGAFSESGRFIAHDDPDYEYQD